MSTQPSLISSSAATKLPVMEHFYTIQGEGAFTGKASYFVRLAGCDVGCVWCDVKESWPTDGFPLYSIDEITALTNTGSSAIVVITGGEPFMHNLTELTTSLQHANKRTHVETSGVYKISGNWDWICFSPKKFKKPDDSIYAVANELKVIINHPSDFEFAEEHAALVNEQCKLFLQPEWSKEKRNAELIINYVKANPKWQISLQTHKYLNIP